MVERPSRFRFGLIALFALIAAVGVLVTLWNPFPKPSKSNFGLIEVGMTEIDVAELVGKPDAVLTENGRLIHGYVAAYGEEWAIVYADGKVVRSLQILSTPVEPPP